MGRFRRNSDEKHKPSRQTRREKKALHRSVSDLYQAWADLGVSMGTSSLRGVVEGMRATAEAIAGPPDADPSTERADRSGSIRGISDLVSTWAQVGVAMGKTALEKSAEGLEVTADALDSRMEKRQEPGSRATIDKPSEPDQT